jgi:hypothetical protein
MTTTAPATGRSQTGKFPTVKGANLEGRRYELPRDLEGVVNVLLIPFQRWHQELVDTWMPALRQIMARHPELRAYELPTLPRMNLIYRMSLDYGMKMGIPDRAVREATITLYLDKDAYRHALDIPDEATIVVMLVTPAGDILWRTTGAYTEEAGRALAVAIQLVTTPP